MRRRRSPPVPSLVQFYTGFIYRGPDWSRSGAAIAGSAVPEAGKLRMALI
jgi:hypothetical protein